MGKILDLSVFQQETLDIRTAEGQLLHIEKPTQAAVIELMKFQSIDNDTPAEEIVAALNRMTELILNNNREGVRFDAASISALSTDAKTAILTEFSKFATRLQSDPI